MARTHEAERITYAMTSHNRRSVLCVSALGSLLRNWGKHISATVSQHATTEAVFPLPERAPHINKPATVRQLQIAALHEDGLADWL
jgi:hypothetical protein